MYKGLIPNLENKDTFQLRQSCRDSIDPKLDSINSIQSNLGSSNRGAFTRSNVALFSGLGIMLRISLCILCAGLFLYAYINEQNALTFLRLQIPVLAKDIRELKESNEHLKYEIELFESPQHLLDLARRSEFSHLKQPLLKEIIALPEGIALQVSSEETQIQPPFKPRHVLATGAK